MADLQPTPTITPPAGQEWVYAFNDEMNDASGMSGVTNGIARTKWNSGWQTGPVPGGLGVINTQTNPVQSQEIQYYDPGSILFPGDGTMRFRLQAGTTFGGRSIRSGMVSTAGLMVVNPLTKSVPAGVPFNVTGPQVIEVMMKVPGPNARAGQFWPVVWMTNAGNYNNGGTFAGGTGYSEEIDIWEWFNGGSTGATAGYHHHQASTYDSNSSPAARDSQDLSLAYHAYTFWTDGSTVKVWIDGIQATDVNPSTGSVQAQFARPQYLMLAFQALTGANLPTSSAGTQTDMGIDYVRVWQGQNVVSPVLVRESVGTAGIEAFQKSLQTDEYASFVRLNQSEMDQGGMVANIQAWGATGIHLYCDPPHGNAAAGYTGDYWIGDGNPLVDGPKCAAYWRARAIANRNTVGSDFRMWYSFGNEWVDHWPGFTPARAALTYHYFHQGLKSGDPTCEVSAGSDVTNAPTRINNNPNRSNIWHIPDQTSNSWGIFDWWRDLAGENPAIMHIGGQNWRIVENGHDYGPGNAPTICETGFDYLDMHVYSGAGPNGGPNQLHPTSNRFTTYQQYLAFCDNYAATHAPSFILWETQFNCWRFVPWVSQYMHDKLISVGWSASDARRMSQVDVTEFGYTNQSWHSGTTYPVGWVVFDNNAVWRAQTAHTGGTRPSTQPNANWRTATPGEATTFFGKAEYFSEETTADFLEGQWQEWFGLKQNVDGIWLGGPSAARNYTRNVVVYVQPDRHPGFKYGLLYKGTRSNPSGATGGLGEKGNPTTADGAYRRLLAYSDDIDTRITAVATVPDKVTGVLAFPGLNQVDLLWNLPSSNGAQITDYVITLAPVAAGPYHTNENTQGIHIDTLDSTQIYTVRVRAVNSVGQGPLSDPVTFQPLGNVTGFVRAPLGAVVKARGTKLDVLGKAKASPGFAVKARGAKKITATSAGQVRAAVGIAVKAHGTAAIIQPQLPPFPPTIVSAVAGNGYVDVTWNQSPNDHGSPVLGYRVTSSTGLTRTPLPATDLSLRFAPLTNGMPVSFTVAARNLGGYGAESVSSIPVTPAGPPPRPPDPPTSVTATAGAPGTGQATITWTASPDTHGNPIIVYTVTSSPGSITATSTGLSTVVGGLTIGQTYTFTVTARTVVGPGLPSSSSNGVTPTGVPLPTGPGLGQLSVEAVHPGKRTVTLATESIRTVSAVHPGTRTVVSVHPGRRTVEPV